MVDKSGKVLAAEQGGPAATVEVVKKLVASGAVSAPAAEEAKDKIPAPATNGANGTKEDVAKADVAAEVADTAEKIDSGEVKANTA